MQNRSNFAFRKTKLLHLQWGNKQYGEHVNTTMAINEAKAFPIKEIKRKCRVIAIPACISSGGLPIQFLTY